MRNSAPSAPCYQPADGAVFWKATGRDHPGVKGPAGSSNEPTSPRAWRERLKTMPSTQIAAGAVGEGRNPCADIVITEPW